MKFYAIILLILSVAIFFSYLTPATTGEYAQNRGIPRENVASDEKSAVGLLLSNVNAEEKAKILKDVRTVERKNLMNFLNNQIRER